jgi:SAM-dependent methyltransferase
MQAQTENSRILRLERDRGVAEKLCLGVSKLFLKPPLSRLSLRNRALGRRFETNENYISDRISNIEDYRKLFSGYCSFEGKVVAELGCSTGYLLASFLEYEHFDPIGIDIDPAALDRGRKLHGGKIRFIQSTRTSIPLPDESADVFYCIDTVEHLKRPREIMMECYRVLRPGGIFLIHFHPWLGPYGAHLEDIIPFPWPHVVFSMDTLLNVAADLYELEGYRPACYWLDPNSGERRPNPYLDHARWVEFLNQMTVAEFKRLLQSLPFTVVHFSRMGFGGKAFRLARFMRSLAQVPLLDEFFLRAVLCVLKKPEAA